MSTDENSTDGNEPKKHEAEVISILPFINNKKKKVEPTQNLVEGFDDYIMLTELATDDLAGTLIARHIYEVDLLPGISSQLLHEELTMRIRAHQDLLEQLEGIIDES